MVAKEKKSSRRQFLIKEKAAFSADVGQGTPPEVNGSNRNVLIVDDNPVVLKAFETKLKPNGFNVTTTTETTTVARLAEQSRAELIILDINFPPSGGMEWNGFTVMQWLRRFPELGQIPVILITGAEVAQHQENARAAGAVALLQKPIAFKDLLAVMAEALGKRAADPAA